MGVESLREAIALRARELRVPALMQSGVTAHKRGWLTCPCSWCARKRRATAEIGNLAGVPAHRLVSNQYTSGGSLRAAYRDELRAAARQSLRRLESDETGLFDV